MTSTKWCVGVNILDFPFHSKWKQYTSKTLMGGVDNMDKDKRLKALLQHVQCFVSGTEWG